MKGGRHDFSLRPAWHFGQNAPRRSPDLQALGLRLMRPASPAKAAAQQQKAGRLRTDYRSRPEFRMCATMAGLRSSTYAYAGRWAAALHAIAARSGRSIRSSPGAACPGTSGAGCSTQFRNWPWLPHRQQAVASSGQPPPIGVESPPHRNTWFALTPPPGTRPRLAEAKFRSTIRSFLATGLSLCAGRLFEPPPVCPELRKDPLWMVGHNRISQET